MGIKERREREKESRRQEIIDAAEKVFFAKGLEAATMDEIAERAELSKGTLYLYFKSKEELYLQIHLRGNRALTLAFAKAVKNKKKGIDKLRAIGDAYYRFYLESPNYFNAIIYYELKDYDLSADEGCVQECAEEGGKTLGVVIDAIETGISDGTIRSDLDPVKTAIALWAKSTGIVCLAAAKGNIFERFYHVTGREIVDYSFNLIFETIKNR
jgi:TetR/AcrR family transcriptional regulator